MSERPTAANLRSVFADLALHSTTAALTDERQFLDDALGILTRYHYDATIEVRRKPGYTLSTQPRAEATDREPEGATTIEVDRQPVGWVAVGGADGEATQLLQLTLAGLARAALTAGDALRDQARRQAILASLYTITSVATTAETLELILQTIYEETSRLLGVDTFIAGLYDEQRNEIYFPLRYDLGKRFPEARIAYDPSTSVSAWLIANRKPLLIRDRDQEQLPVAAQSFGEERRVQSWLGVPMIARGQVVGILAIQSYTANAFDAADQDLLNQIAQQAGLAIISQRGRAAYQRRLDELGALNELSRELSASVVELPLPDLLELIRSRLSQFVIAGHFFTALYDQASDTVHFPLATEGGQRVVWRPRRSGHAMTEHLIARAAPLLIRSDVGEYTRKLGIERVGKVPQSWLGVPIWVGGRVIGVMVLQSYEEGLHYTPEDERIMVAAAAQAGGAIQIARLLAEEQRQRAEMEEANRRLAGLFELIRELSTPVIPIVAGVLALPLIGTIDSHRATQITDHLLHEISRQQASVVLLDITGVPIVDTIVASYLIQAIKASQLLGARCVLVGIRPEVAQTMIELGMDLTGVTTLATLQEGVAYGLRMRGLAISPRQPRHSTHAPPGS